MTNLTYSESDVQSLKAQEAKDYCIELMELVKAKEGGPISPGEVQLQELQYELQLKEAEAADNRLREEHLERTKDLELQIQQEKAELARCEMQADQRREKYARVIEQVAESQEKLSVQLDRATREHNVKLQLMQSKHDQHRESLDGEMQELIDRRDDLVQQIGKLADLSNAAEDVDRLKAEIEDKQLSAQRHAKQLDEEIEAAAFDKEKELKRIRREHELELAELEAAHRKQLLDSNTESLDALLGQLGMTKINPDELTRLRDNASEQQRLAEQQVQSIRDEAVAEFKQRFNVNASEPIDVTDLFYREKALQEENEAHEKQIQKLDSEIGRMRTHIESESARVAKAIEAARTNIQNNIEPGVKR